MCIKNGFPSTIPTIFWGAGQYAATVFRALNEKYAPVAFGDSDRKKFGTFYMGLPVLSLNEIQTQYPNCHFYITVQESRVNEIIHSLTDRGIVHSRIINLFEEIQKYKSCGFLETNMSLSNNALRFCCSDFGKNKSPVVSKRDSYEKTILDFLKTRDRIIEDLNTNSPETISSPCLGCHEVKEGLWYINRRIRLLRISMESFCNFKCVYCHQYFDKYDDIMQATFEDSIKFLYYLKNNKYIDGRTLILCSAGEVTAHPMREKLLDFLQDNPCWIYSNASAYNNKIAEILTKDGSRLVSSIDAGTQKTFKKIKGVDLFDTVCDNLGRYAQNGFVQLKYIVLPGLNDNEEDVSGIIDVCKRTKIKQLSISRNNRDIIVFSENTISMISLLIQSARKHGIYVTVPDWIFTGTVDNQRLEEKMQIAATFEPSVYIYGQ